MPCIACLRWCRTPLFSLFFIVVTQLVPHTGMTSTPPPVLDLSEPEEQSVPASPEEIERANQVEITTPPPLPQQAREQDYFYRYRQALTVRGGALIELNNVETLGSNFGFQYRFPFASSQRVEIGADLLNEGAGVLHASRFHFSDDSRMRWFHKYGIGIRIVPAQQLVTFLKLANWQARLGGGLEWTIADPFSFRMDLEATLSTEKLAALATVGAAYGW